MKVLLDTNVLIEFFRNPVYREEFESRSRRPLLFMSSVVALELFAGCRTSRQVRALESFLKPFEKAGRVLIPDYQSFCEAGRVLAALGSEGIGTARRRLLVNDVLIAVTATKSGALLVTQNNRDFARIAKHIPVRWMSPSKEI